MNRRQFAIGLACSLAVATWILAAPVLGLPGGVAASTGESMGDEGLTLNFWVDAEPSVGDIIILDAGETGMTHERPVHRIVGETEQGYVTQGDANDFVDQDRGVVHATDETTIGVVVARVPLQNIGGASAVLSVGYLLAMRIK